MGCAVSDAISRALPTPINEVINQLGNPDQGNVPFDPSAPGNPGNPASPATTNASNPANDPNDIVIPKIDTSTLLDRITVTYKPLAREQASEFSLDDISSPRLIEIAGVDFATNGTILLGSVDYPLVKTTDGDRAYLRITNFSPSDYTNFSATNANASIRIRFRSADDIYRVNMYLTTVNVIKPPMPAPPMVASIGATYKPFATGHNDKFSLGDFDSLYLVRVDDDRFATAGSRIILNNVTNEITKTDYQDSTYVGLKNFSFNDYTALRGTGATLTIKMNLVAADGTYIASNQTIASGLMVTSTTDIHTWQDLQGMKHNLAGEYQLRNDITFPDKGNEGLPMEGFDPVGDSSANAFTGRFNGNGRTITDLSIDRGSRNNVGIWGYVDNPNSVIKDFVVDHAGIRGWNGVGAVVGYLAAGTVNNVGVVSSQSNDVTGNANVGGLLGVNETGTVTNSYATGTVIATGNTAGGLVGRNDGTVVGYATGAVTGGNNVGGLVGWNDGTATGYATGTVSGTGNNIGGLVGDNSGTATGYATGTVSGTGNNIGGLVGGNNGRVTGYATGAVSGNNRVGSLVGGNNGRVTGYATGRVTSTGGGMFTGGLVGGNAGSGAVNGYWDEATTGQNGSAGGGVGISSIANVVFSTPATYTDNRGTAADATDDVVVFNNTTFLMHFTLPGANATWPTLKAAAFFPQP